jgi:hypothetical protein
MGLAGPPRKLRIKPIVKAEPGFELLLEFSDGLFARRARTGVVIKSPAFNRPAKVDTA